MKYYLSVVHDFYEVQSARGVYITSVKEDGMSKDQHMYALQVYNQ